MRGGCCDEGKVRYGSEAKVRAVGPNDARKAALISIQQIPALASYYIRVLNVLYLNRVGSVAR